MPERGEHVTWREPDAPADGFNAFGKPVSIASRDLALSHVRAIAPELSTETATAVVNRMAEQIERDEPYKCLQASGVPSPDAAMKTLDLTGSYRIMAALCTHPKEER